MILLEKDKRLSESMIWKMLEEYYDTASIKAWDQIPFYPTSNPFIAETYAEMILAFLKDYRPFLDLEEPVYIMELATGSGCFSFYLLQELERKLAYFQSSLGLKLKYVMTDFTKNNVKSWESNEKLKPYIESGKLELAVFRPETDSKLLLRPSSTTVSSGFFRNPVIVIANYFFDSIKQDAFQIRSGELYEALHSFYHADESKPIFAKMRKSESYSKANPNHYADADFNQILQQYQNEYLDASVLFPIGALNCLQNLRDLTQNKLVLLSSDKGFTDKAYIVGHREQTFLPHHGVFSYSVNYDAIKRYFENQGGTSLNTSDDNLSIATSANYLLPKQECLLEESRFYFAEKVCKQNVANYLYFLQDFLVEIKPSKSNELLRACLAYVQLCNFDPILFCLVAPYIYEAIETINRAQEEQLLMIIEKVRANFYAVQQQFDVFYWIGRVYYGLNHALEAIEEFRHSIKIFGPNSATLYYMAAAHELRQEHQSALDIYELALQFEPTCTLTQANIKRLQDGPLKQK
ncbi:MAG: hypothetical protein K2W82_15490 [Candidatus Obscuribacterales bacterium]|nr:hypothetical protein [Candidatus Obscuribacterales bacterium]